MDNIFGQLTSARLNENGPVRLYEQWHALTVNIYQCILKFGLNALK